eukprot:NODE_60_length_27201_cov_1.043318.p10 type:complete len:419 gc:universal NODE_60_length_27201_cov_1.043318:8769-10025(+)
MSLECVFYSEFEPQVGPKLLHLIPSDYDHLEDFSSFYIPKSYFCNRMLCVEMNRLVLVSHPVYIEDPKYERNLFAFNIGVILNAENKVNEEDDVIEYEKEDTTEPVKFSNIRVRCQHIIRKLAMKFKEFEITNQFITKDKSRLQIKYLLNILKSKIMVGDQFNILFDDLNYLSIDMVHRNEQAILFEELYDHLVPIPLFDLDEMEFTCPTIKRVACHLNGFDSIRQISSNAEASPEFIKLVLQQLYYAKMIDLTDIFQFKNCYSLTPIFKLFCDDSFKKSKALQYVSKINISSLDIAIYYAQVRSGETVSSFVKRVVFPMDLLDVRRFFIHGIASKILRRVREYPILRRDGKLRHYHSSSLLSQVDDGGKMNDLLQLVRNNKDLDELCILLELTPSELQKIFQQQFSEDDQFLVSICK